MTRRYLLCGTAHTCLAAPPLPAARSMEDKELNESLALSGTIDTVRGYASYYGKKFEIEEGHVIFTGS